MVVSVHGAGAWPYSIAPAGEMRNACGSVDAGGLQY